MSLYLIALTALLISYACARRVLRADGLRGFVRHVTGRATAGSDVLLFTVGLTYILMALIALSVAFHLPFIAEPWFIEMRRQVNVLINVALALYLLNGKLATWITKWFQTHGSR